MALFISLSAGNAQTGLCQEAGSGWARWVAQTGVASCCLRVLHQGQSQGGLQT